MSLLLNATVSLSVIGLVLGGGLAFASKKFAVEIDPKEKAILDALPGANCGGCGFPGCGGLATAIFEGNAGVSDCPVGGAACAEKIASILGVEADVGNKQVFHVMCKGGKSKAKIKAEYVGIMSCRAATMVSGGPKVCTYSCVGYGTCVEACAFDAIHINDEGIAVVDVEKCVACGKCAEVCPRQVIDKVPYDQTYFVSCNNKVEKGKDVMQACKVGCIACTRCIKVCNFDAIHMVGNIAVIDYDKCTNCSECYKVCPTAAIEEQLTGKAKKQKTEEESA